MIFQSLTQILQHIKPEKETKSLLVPFELILNTNERSESSFWFSNEMPNMACCNKKIF